jgi:hypothetical protein
VQHVTFSHGRHVEAFEDPLLVLKRGVLDAGLHFSPELHE